MGRCIVASLLLIGAAAGAIDPPIVHTDDGPIQGYSREGLQIFEGVPFAAPPTGALRFKPPQRPKPWREVKQTTEPGSKCPQLDIMRGKFQGNESCLFLSVYVPEGCTRESPCPVMQWIYGGAWILGSNHDSNYTSIALRQKVVIVAGNYRLDVLGWIALEELEKEDAESQYGNYGLKDQGAALEWTQRNIAGFGGGECEWTDT